MKIDHGLKAAELLNGIDRMWELSAAKIRTMAKEFDPAKGSPVFTVRGRYTTRGWTEWTQGFDIGSTMLQFDATGDAEMLERGRDDVVQRMAPHVTHFGVHDHGFNNISTYGNLLRLMNEGRIHENAWERNFYELALKCSGAVQARRWTDLGAGKGYIYSFNGPQSLFADTIRSCRSLAVSHQLGHVLMGENDRPVSLLGRLLAHAEATSRYNVYFGEGRDAYDERGRVAHESIFNVNDGCYRCPSSQQGYSPFTTWTRGLAWIMCGFAEELEFLDVCADDELAPFGGRETIVGLFEKTARASCDFYIANTAADGIPYWDGGAPGLHRLGDYRQKIADPFNAWEPVDSSAAAIGAQGLLRLGAWLSRRGNVEDAARYTQAGLTVLQTLLKEPYLSTDVAHHGLLLHSVYHRPNNWDHIPEGMKVPCGESSMWGDYHLRELALYVQRRAEGAAGLHFYL
jgi:unsaturated chondroitin disaccharide hydrolase